MNLSFYYRERKQYLKGTSIKCLWAQERGFPSGSAAKTPPADAGATGEVGLIPGPGRSLEKEMATHSSILCRENSMRRSPRLQSLDLQRVGHKWATEHEYEPKKRATECAWSEIWPSGKTLKRKQWLRAAVLGQEGEWTSRALHVNDLSSLVAGCHWVTDSPECYQRWGKRKWQRPSGEGIGVKGSCAVLFPKLKNEHGTLALLVQLQPVSSSPPSFQSMATWSLFSIEILEFPLIGCLSAEFSPVCDRSHSRIFSQGRT